MCLLLQGPFKPVLSGVYCQGYFIYSPGEASKSFLQMPPVDFSETGVELQLTERFLVGDLHRASEPTESPALRTGL